MGEIFVMTISLLLDTATSRTSIAINDGEKEIFSAFHDGAMDHGRALTELVSQALKRENRIDEVRVGMGPGPFSGLRVGIAFARTFSLARNIPLIGFCSLDAIASQEDEYIAVTDARRKEVYWARYNNGARVDGPHVNFPADVPEGKYIGEGAVKYGLSHHDGFPDMAQALKLSGNILEPLYLRRPDAVPTAERR